MHTHALHVRDRRSQRARARGFTLIEMSLVVVVVAILAVLAILGYRRYTTTAKSAEAKQVTGGIRMAQEAYKTEKGVYVTVSSSDTAFYPAATPGKFVTAWGAPCTNCVAPDAWHNLPMAPPQPVMFGYATVANIGGSGGSSSSSGILPMVAPPPGLAPLSSTDPFYVTVAWGDTDGDGVPCTITSYSTSNQLLVQSEGE
jgi:type IV pilus assembly protein PilA